MGDAGDSPALSARWGPLHRRLRRVASHALGHELRSRQRRALHHLPTVSSHIFPVERDGWPGAVKLCNCFLVGIQAAHKFSAVWRPHYPVALFGYQGSSDIEHSPVIRAQHRPSDIVHRPPSAPEPAPACVAQVEAIERCPLTTYAADALASPKGPGLL